MMARKDSGLRGWAGGDGRGALAVGGTGTVRQDPGEVGEKHGFPGEEQERFCGRNPHEQRSTR